MTGKQLIGIMIGAFFLMAFKRPTEKYPGEDKPMGSDEYPGAEKAPDAILVSPHFRWSEFTVSARFPRLAARAARDWTKQTRANTIKLASTILEPLRDIIGKPINILSGYRPEYLNTPSGGAIGSQHITASAVDIRPTEATPEDFEKIMEWAKENRRKFGQIIFYFRVAPTGPGDSHRVHVSLEGNRLGNVKYHGGGHRYTDILPSLK